MMNIYTSRKQININMIKKFVDCKFVTKKNMFAHRIIQ